MNAMEYTDYLVHHGIKNQKWGVRRYQNEDGSLTEEGKRRYAKASKHVRQLNAENRRKMSADYVHETAMKDYGNAKNKFGFSANQALTAMMQSKKYSDQSKKKIKKLMNKSSNELKDLNMHLGYDIITGTYNIAPNRKDI